MKRIFAVTLFAVFLTACSGSKKTTANTNTETNATAAKGTEDGLSYETAVVIHEKHEGPGIDAEYKWIKEHYSGYKIKGQSLNTVNKKWYDIITIELSNGKDVKLYFDITQFYGKF